jgi:sporulation protein YlmC with PRC-barrel domain
VKAKEKATMELTLLLAYAIMRESARLIGEVRPRIKEALICKVIYLKHRNVTAMVQDVDFDKNPKSVKQVHANWVEPCAILHSNVQTFWTGAVFSTPVPTTKMEQ